ncbi:MAG: DUF5011 domain-containing protein [Saprospirales bacterium]|nr:DUF5011 domain-containing protein [Saprospirales bacterium]
MCTQTIVVEDNTNPMITCPSNITSANDPGQCCAVETFLAPTTSDDCSTVSLAQTAGLGSGSCFPVGLTTNTFVATDACNNTATCSFTVTVTDNQAPSITCPSNISVNNDPGQCCAVVNYTAPVGTDNCPGQTTAQTAGQASGFCFPVGVTTNTFVVTAANSQTASCSFTVTVTDNEPPAISCPSNVSVNNDPGQCCAVVNYTAPVGTDNCPGQSTAQTAGQASGFCFPVGVTTNTFVVTAANSQTATCSFTVTVTDNEAPMISCPSNISVNNDPGQCCAVVNYTAPIGTDNCPGQSTAQTAGQASGFCFPVGVTTNTFVVTAANSQTATCSFTVTVTDNEPPAISCPSNVSVNNDPGVCCAVVNYTAPVGTDNCTGQSTAQTAGQASGFCFPVGVTTNTFVVTAANSQTATCSFTVTVTDNQNPNIATCPVTRNIVGCGIGDITGPAYSSTPAASSYAEFSNGTNQGVGNDNCGITSVSYADAVPTGFCPVVVIRTWTLSDGVNSVSCNQTINIKHTAAPGEVGGPVMTTSTVSCPADAVPPPVLPVVEDVCGNTIPAPVPTITNDLFPAGCVGTRTYTYTYLDNCASQIFIWAYVYTIDYSSGLTPPASTMSTVSCPALASNPGPPANITDACGCTVSAALVGSTSTPDPVTCEGQVVWTYRYTACDGTTTADWTHTYTIDYSGGLTPPTSTISTVACATLASNPGPPANITDACGRTVSAVLVGSTSTPDPVTCEGTVEWRYRYTACDGTTTADWTHTYTIDNNIPPVITLQGDASLVICKGDTYVDAGATASDDCQGNITPGVVTVNPVNTAVAGIYTVTYDVTDCAGNPALQVSRTVQVIEPLAVTPSAPSEMFCSQGSSTITVALGADSDAFNVSASVISGAASGYTPSQTNLPGGSLLDPAAISNTGGVDAVIEYTITPYHYGYDGQNDNGADDDCAGPATVVTITVKPEPVGANQSIPICSGGVLSIDLQGIINAYGNGLASSFSWAAANNNDVNGENTLPTAGGLINNQLTLVNPGNGPQIVIYTVTPTGLNGCPGMSFTVKVEVAPCEVSIIDPCTCLDNATTLVNGQFSETIQVDGPAGDSWTVVLAPGLYQMASLAPPAAPLPVAAGTPLAEGPPGVYTLAGKHIDALGYSISVTNGSVTLSTSNTCYYPNPSLSGLNDVYCSQDGAQVATVSAQLGDGSGPATVENILFELIRQSDNTVVASQSGVANTFNFNPAALAQGHYTLRVTFDGADDGVGHPGCEQAVEEDFEVRKVGCGVFPWNGN